MGTWKALFLEMRWLLIPTNPFANLIHLGTSFLTGRYLGVVKEKDMNKEILWRKGVIWNQTPHNRNVIILCFGKYVLFILSKFQMFFWPEKNQVLFRSTKANSALSDLSAQVFFQQILTIMFQSLPGNTTHKCYLFHEFIMWQGMSDRSWPNTLPDVLDFCLDFASEWWVTHVLASMFV